MLERGIARTHGSREEGAMPPREPELTKTVRALGHVRAMTETAPSSYLAGQAQCVPAISSVCRLRTLLLMQTVCSAV